MQDFVNKTKNNLAAFEKEFEEYSRRAGREGKVNILFATKYINSDQLISFLELTPPRRGRVLIGENRVQDAQSKLALIREKRPDLIGRFKLVMIGNLQKNKINKAIEIFEELYAIDSLELARAVNSRLKKTMPIFLELKLSEEQTKHGFSADILEKYFPEISRLPMLKINGLMTMAPYYDDPEKTRPIFRSLRKLADKYKILTSMGMSHDWKQALEEGSDLIRIGSIIFA